MMGKLFLFAAFTVFITIVFISCDDTVSNTDIDNVEIPSSDVSYPEYIQPVFNAKCNFSGCHNSADRAGSLSLESWAEATADPLIVFPGEPESSKLIWAINGLSGAAAMPPVGYPPLTKNQREGIATWIREGANSN